MAQSGNKKKHSPTQKENYKAYDRERRWMKNRKKRLERHILNNEKDTCAVKALEVLTLHKEPRGPRRSLGNIRKVEATPDLSTFLPQKSIAEQLRALRNR